MARFNNETVFRSLITAATAGAQSRYFAVTQTFYFQGFCWFYESTEANSDNTLDFVIDYTTDGTNFTTLHTNANAVGFLDTGAPLVVFENMGNAGSAGGAAVAVTPTGARVPAGATLRVTCTTAGTGTIKAMQFDVFGQTI